MENTELKALLEKLQSLETLTKEENDLLATYIAKQDTEVEKPTEEKARIFFLLMPCISVSVYRMGILTRTGICRSSSISSGVL